MSSKFFINSPERNLFDKFKGITEMINCCVTIDGLKGEIKPKNVSLQEFYK